MLEIIGIKEEIFDSMQIKNSASGEYFRRKRDTGEWDVLVGFPQIHWKELANIRYQDLEECYQDFLKKKKER